MSEYRVTYSEIPNPHSDNQTHSGVLIHVQPPVPLNPDAVTRYLSFSDFEPIDLNEKWEKHDVKDVVVLGSTPEQTTIYASINSRHAGRLAERAAHHTVELLQFMGATAIIDNDNPPIPVS
jgi:hypothetical protein